MPIYLNPKDCDDECVIPNIVYDCKTLILTISLENKTGISQRWMEKESSENLWKIER